MSETNFNFAASQGLKQLTEEEMIAFIRQKLPGKVTMHDYLANYGKFNRLICSFQHDYSVENSNDNFSNLAGRYLMPISQCKLDFLYDILTGQRKTISVSEVVKMPCPRYPELSLRQLIQHVNSDPDLAIYFPREMNEKTKLSRE